MLLLLSIPFYHGIGKLTFFQRLCGIHMVDPLIHGFLITILDDDERCLICFWANLISTLTQFTQPPNVTQCIILLLFALYVVGRVVERWWFSKER
ncbi:hypothetical protein FR483_n818R [Paramecium bursaria Chlorella virus FR483]|uniref:Uncharacterized protein n818R n=1 Tax=Paramecium bursaria Chlorella virus FR483 TaxID=399781 RepID=A7J8H2_PBCVF|nr:hypothetical protein FR483_n818R [Paramecium bursaria Chlorella virus FR483]ABT16103.1 hypothetical protein FR483_n818R [Paramecium bursaria Chlorella virus FR483]